MLTDPVDLPSIKSLCYYSTELSNYLSFDWQLLYYHHIMGFDSYRYSIELFVVFIFNWDGNRVGSGKNRFN